MSLWNWLFSWPVVILVAAFFLKLDLRLLIRGKSRPAVGRWSFASAAPLTAARLFIHYLRATSRQTDVYLFALWFDYDFHYNNQSDRVQMWSSRPVSPLLALTSRGRWPPTLRLVLERPSSWWGSSFSPQLPKYCSLWELFGFIINVRSWPFELNWIKIFIKILSSFCHGLFVWSTL